MASCSACGRKESVRALPSRAWVHCGRAEQAAQADRGKLTRMLSLPHLSRVKVQCVAICPCGQVTVCASQLIQNAERWRWCINRCNLQKNYAVYSSSSGYARHTSSG